MDFYSRALIISRLLDSGRDIRFSLRAYEFVFFIFSVLKKSNPNANSFSSKEIVETSVKIANSLYGPIAELVLSDAGIKTINDIESIISNLVYLNIFTKSSVYDDFEFSQLSLKTHFSKVCRKPLNIEKLKIFEDT